MHVPAPVPGSVKIIDKSIIPSYIKVYADSILLHYEVDYSYDNATIYFLSDITESITIDYAVFTGDIFRMYQVYEPFNISDSTSVRDQRARWDASFLENQRLNITGSKSISISVSNTDMVDINQSLYLRIDGELASNVFIRAQLNDSRMPITPDGTSREIRSLDELYFSIYGREYEIIFGDINLNITGTRFINFHPRVEGLKLSYFDRQKATAIVAVSNAQSAYISMSGVEGKQGPYFLKPDNQQKTVQVVAGSESIWLNGVQVYRGSDYRIDYTDGSVEFLLRHFISSNTRISASFQYTDEEYRKNAYMGTTDFLLSDRLRLRTALIYESDDRDNPLSGSFSAYDIDLLKNATSDRIFVSGASYIGSGMGLYRKDFVTVDGQIAEIYIYAPASSDADFEVRFSWVGEGQGDYRQVTTNRYDYVGKNMGAWLPLREIMAPQTWANYDVSLHYQHDFFDIYTESLFSEHNKNTFSTSDNKDNFSQIHHISVGVFPDWDRLNPRLSSSLTYRQKNLFTFANIKAPEDLYQFSSLASTDSLSSIEYYFDLTTFSFDMLRSEASYKKVDFEDAYQQQFLSLRQSIGQQRFIPMLSYRFAYAESQSRTMTLPDMQAPKLSTTKIAIHEPSGEYRYDVFTLSGDARYFKQRYFEGSAHQISGNQTNFYHTQLSMNKIYHTSIAVSYQYEDNFFYLRDSATHLPPEMGSGEGWHKSRESDTWSIQSYTQYNRQYFTALYSHREVKNFDIQNKESHIQKFDIAELRSMNSLFSEGLQLSGTYLLKNTEFFPRSRELVYVGQGVGLYDSTGTFVSSGDYDWDSVIVGEPIRSIEVNTHLTGYTYPANFIGKDHDFFDFFSRINLETQISIAEQVESSERWKVYLLYPEALKNSIYSQREFRQVIWYNIQKNKLISRYTYRMDKTVDSRFDDHFISSSNRATASSSLTEHELSVRLLRLFIHDIESAVKRRNEKDSRYDMTTDSIIYEIMVRTSSSTNLIFNTSVGYEQENLTSRGSSQYIDRYTLGEEITYFYKNVYRLNAGISWKYNSVRDAISAYLPFDKVAGSSATWKVGCDYRINRISTINFTYSGYKHPRQEPFHQVKMEVRAEF
jgi:hypothetical protein